MSTMLLSRLLLLSLSISHVVSFIVDDPIDEDIQTPQTYRPHFQCLNNPGHEYPESLKFDYSTITPGSMGLLFFGHMGSGKSRIVERVTLLASQTIASTRLNVNRRGVTQEATPYTRFHKNVRIDAIDTVGFCDGTTEGRQNIVTSTLSVPAMISQESIQLKRIYFVMDIAENNLCFVEGNLNFLKLAYGVQAASQICFVLNCCDKIVEEAKPFFDGAVQMLRQLYENVFPGHPDGFKVLFISAVVCPGQLFDDIRMARHDSDIVLGDPEPVRIYLQLPSLIQELDQSLSKLQAELDVQRQALTELESAKKTLEESQTEVKDKIRDATVNRDATQKDLQSQLKNQMTYTICGDYPVATNQWRLFDIDTRSSETTLYEKILFEAQDGVALAQGAPDSRPMTSRSVLEFADDLLGKSNSDSTKFDIIQFTKLVHARIKDQSSEAYQRLKSVISFQEIDQVLESRRQLYDRIGDGNAVRFRLNAHKNSKHICSDVHDLQRRAETCVSDVKPFWMWLNESYKKHVSATDKMSKLTPTLAGLKKQIEDEEKVQADLEKKINAKDAEIKALEAQVKSNTDLFRTKSDELNALKSQFKNFEMMLGHVVDTDDGASTSAANSSENE